MPGCRLATRTPRRYVEEVYSLVHIRSSAMVGSSRRTTTGTGFLLHGARNIVVTAAHVVAPGGGRPVSATVDLWPVHAQGWGEVSAVAVGYGDALLGEDVAVLLLDDEALTFDSGYVLAPPEHGVVFHGGLLYGYVFRNGDIFSQRNDYNGVREDAYVRFTQGGGYNRMSGGPATLRQDGWPKPVAGVYAGYRDFPTGRHGYATVLTPERANGLAGEAHRALSIGN